MAFTEFLIALVVALIVAKVLEEVFVRLGLPPVIGDIVAGIIVGKSFLGIFVPEEGTVTDAFAWLGVVLLLFYAGLETDYRSFIGGIRRFIVVSLLDVSLAFINGFIVGWILGYPLNQSIFIGTILVATSVSLTVKTLLDLGKLDTDEGLTILGVAVLDDIQGLIVLVAALSVVVYGVVSIKDIAFVSISAFLFWLSAVIVIGRLSSRIFKVFSRLHIDNALPILSIILGLLVAALAGVIGLSPIVGAYAAGLALARCRRFQIVPEKIKVIVDLLATLFFVASSARIAIETAIKPEYVWLYALFIGFALLGKTMGNTLGSRITGLPWSKALIVGVGMWPRAEVALIAATIGMTHGVVSTPIYFATVMLIIVTSIIVPPTIKLLYKIQESKSHTS